MFEPSEALPLVPLTSGVVLPHMVFSMALETDEAKAAVEAALVSTRRIVLVPHLGGRYAPIGVRAEIIEAGELSGIDGVVVRALERVRVGAAVPGTGRALWVEVENLPAEAPSPAVHELAREYRAVLESIFATRGGRHFAERLRQVVDPSELADVAGYLPDLTAEQRLELLTTLDVETRLRLVLAWAKETLADLALRERIKTDVEEGMEKTQREFLLRRQLDEIRQELAELAGVSQEDAPNDYRAKMAEKDLPDTVKAALERELSRLERLSDQSPEQSWIRTWIETVLDLPFGEFSNDRFDLDEARRILDEDHYGLSEVKQRVIEHLAVLERRRDRALQAAGRGAGAILALVGPPGVGKTSLGESIARATGRKFSRIALGGVRDEAEIRGHRRTYVGAQPGRLVRALREAGTMNPVILLDEVDKLGADYRGDPASALLEVLDPAQNHTFRDHYLEVELDLSKVMFIATANAIDTIPEALLDRLEVIRLDGYSADEKAAIARQHLLTRQLDQSALSGEELVVSDAALRVIISDYTREAGVRAAERELARLCRKVAAKLAERQVSSPVVIDAPDVKEWLGRPRFFFEAADRTAVPGVATGLAVTGVGGDVLYIEASAMQGAEALTLTGQLGEVMRESGEIALSYVRSHADRLGIGADSFKNQHFHLHVPAGAVPKDGPSAGITMVTAIVSLLRDEPVSEKVAMTGEVTLQGRVLAIGGVRQKLLAAHRAGLTRIILPARNEIDLDDLPDSVREELDIHLVSDVEEVLQWAFARDEEAAAPLAEVTAA